VFAGTITVHVAVTPPLVSPLPCDVHVEPASITEPVPVIVIVTATIGGGGGASGGGGGGIFASCAIPASCGGGRDGGASTRFDDVAHVSDADAHSCAVVQIWSFAQSAELAHGSAQSESSGE